MSKKYKILIVSVIALTILVLGVIIGIAINSKTVLEIDQKIRYSELLNWITTVFIGFLVGYIFKNQYENNKIVKTYLLDDLKQISTQVIIIKDYCYTLRKNSSLTDEQRKDIISKVNLLDKKIKVFTELLKDCDKGKHQVVNDKLVNSLNSYNRKLTCDGFYDNPMETIYFDDIMSESSKFESEVRKITLTIIKQM